MPTLIEPKWFADLESNGLLGHDPWMPKASTIWIFAAYLPRDKKYKLYVRDDLLTQEVRDYCEDYPGIKRKLTLGDQGEYTLQHHYSPIEIHKLSNLKKDLKKNQNLIAMHNGIKYDAIVLRDLMGIKLKPKKLVDTFLLSALSDPDRFPGHGLAAWGTRLGVPKPEHEEWDKFSLEMIHRCLQDCYLTYRVWKATHSEMTDETEAMLGVNWSESIDLEHRVAWVIAESEAEGFPFQKEFAEKALKSLKKYRDKLDKKLGLSSTFLPSRGTGRGLSPSRYDEVMGKLADLYEELGHVLFEDMEEADKSGYAIPVLSSFTKAGNPTLNTIKYWAPHDVSFVSQGKTTILESKLVYPDDYIQFVPDICGAYSKVTWEPINLSSNNQLIQLLQSKGWEPTEKTDKGNPKITEDSLENFVKTFPKFKYLKDRIVVGYRISTLKNENNDQKGLINLVREDGTIPSLNNTLGTNTHRSRHKKIVNIPSTDAPHGALFRECFTSLPYDGEQTFKYDKHIFDKLGRDTGKTEEVTAKGRMALIGCDAQALESRILGALMGDDAFIQEVLNGDIHAVFLETVKEFIESRSAVKGVEYAFIYGAGAPKLGSMVTMGRDVVTRASAKDKGWKEVSPGKWMDSYRKKMDWEPLPWKEVQDTLLGMIIISRFLRGVPALGKLVNDSKAFATRHKLILGVDGRRFKIRKTHSVLNLKIQSTGAILMKRALVIARKEFKKAGLPWHLHCFYHDEFNVSVPPQDIVLASKILEQSIISAGEYYKLKCPMDAEAKHGLTWCDVH